MREELPSNSVVNAETFVEELMLRSSKTTMYDK
jgi:hypothetical protein